MKDKRRDEMLIQFNSDYEKISMGLLSFIEDFKDPARLQEEIERYKISEERDLFLWQSEETGNLIGLIGIEKEKNGKLDLINQFNARAQELKEKINSLEVRKDGIQNRIDNVQEEIDALKTRMTKNEEHDEEQDDDIEVLEEYVGSWDKYRGEVAYTGFNYWVPSIADAIGDMCELIMGPDGATKFDDVAADHWASGFINVGVTDKFINGKNFANYHICINFNTE